MSKEIGSTNSVTCLIYLGQVTGSLENLESLGRSKLPVASTYSRVVKIDETVLAKTTYMAVVIVFTRKTQNVVHIPSFSFCRLAIYAFLH